MMIKISVLRGIKLFYDIFFYKDSLFEESVCISIECYITQKAAKLPFVYLIFYGLLSDFVCEY